MNNILLSPPIAFLFFLALSFGISQFSKLLAAKGKASAGKQKAYACGESTYITKVQPDYTQFFPFAIFFTLMHVVALIVTTVPSGIPFVAVLYLGVAGLAIVILFRR